MFLPFLSTSVQIKWGIQKSESPTFVPTVVRETVFSTITHVPKSILKKYILKITLPRVSAQREREKHTHCTVITEVIHILRDDSLMYQYRFPKEICCAKIFSEELRL